MNDMFMITTVIEINIKHESSIIKFVIIYNFLYHVNKVLTKLLYNLSSINI